MFTRYARLHICPLTRKRHKFDAATHQCQCGAWERGHKPKQEPVRPRNECQICERTQALNSAGCLGHHGYKRPGWGCIHGGCMGVGYKPYPETDALVLYLAAVEAHIERCQKRIESLPMLTELEYEYSTGYGDKKVTHKVTIHKGDESVFIPKSGYSIPSFAHRIEIIRGMNENEIKFATQDRSRVEKRIAAAKVVVA